MFKVLLFLLFILFNTEFQKDVYNKISFFPFFFYFKRLNQQLIPSINHNWWLQAEHQKYYCSIFQVFMFSFFLFTNFLVLLVDLNISLYFGILLSVVLLYYSYKFVLIEKNNKKYNKTKFMSVIMLF